MVLFFDSVSLFYFVRFVLVCHVVLLPVSLLFGLVSFTRPSSASRVFKSAPSSRLFVSCFVLFLVSLDVFPELLVCTSLVFLVFFFFFWFCWDLPRSVFVCFVILDDSFIIEALFLCSTCLLPFVLLAVGSSRFESNESLSNLRKCHWQKSGGGVPGEKWQLLQTVFQHL